MITFEKIPLSIAATIAGCLNEISTGLQFGWSSVSLPKLVGENADNDVFISNNEGFWITVALLMGNLISPLFTNLFVNKIGRKPVLLIASALIAVSWIIMAFANNTVIYFLSRFLGGFGDGLIISTTLIYYGEISSSQNRGCINSIMPSLFAVGVLIITILGHYITMFNISIISLCLAIISFLIFLCVPESPYYLIMIKKYKEAKASIKKFNPTLNSDLEFTRIFSAIEKQMQNSSKLLDVFNIRAYRKMLFISLGLRTIQQCIGIQAILLYLEEILNDSTKKREFVINYGAIIVFSIQTAASFLCAVIVDKAGRKPLMLLSLVGVSLTLLCQTVYFSLHNLTNFDLQSYELVPLISLMFYIISLNIGMCPVPHILIAEVFPINIKSVGVFWCESFNIIFGIGITKIFQYTKDEYGMHIPYFLFFMSGIMGCFFIYFIVPETKGKNLEEIQEMLNLK